MSNIDQEEKMNEFFELLIKGIPIGISNTLPGISGGTMALVLGIYDRLVNGIKKINFRILIPIFIGAVIGVLGGSKLIVNLLEIYPGFTTAFLLGLIFASSKVTFDEIEEFDLPTILLVIIGILLAIFYSVDINSTKITGDLSYLQLFFGGAVGSVAMILPGISGGTILIMFGLYQGVLEAINTFNLPFLMVFGGGVVVGLLAFSWLLSYLLDRFRSLLMALLTGLILGSIRSVIPATFGFEELIGFMLGVLIIYLLIKNDK